MAQATSWNPASYAKNARFVSDLGEPLLALLDGKPGETILDLGCGDGALTRKDGSVQAALCTAAIRASRSFKPRASAASKFSSWMVRVPL